MSESQEDLIPRPDPSTLTTAQLYRELVLLKEFLATQRESDLELSEAKFKGIDQRFIERNQWLEMSFRDSKEAVATALEAAEKSNIKSEAATGKNLDSLNSKIDDVRDLALRREGQQTAVQTTHENTNRDAALIISIVAILVSILMVIVVVMLRR